MKIQLTKIDKIELLKAIKTGVLDTLKVPALVHNMEGANLFLELLKELPEEDE